MTEAQRRAAEMLGRGYSMPETARAVHVDLRTLRGWVNGRAGAPRIPGMREYMEKIRAELPEPTAVDTLRALLSSDSEKIRLQAAAALLRSAGRVYD